MDHGKIEYLKEDGDNSSDYQTTGESQSTMHSSEFNLDVTDVISHQGSEIEKKANSKISCSPDANSSISSRRASISNTTTCASEVSPNDQTLDTANQSILDISNADISMISTTKCGTQEKFQSSSTIFKPTPNFQPSLKPNAAIP